MKSESNAPKNPIPCLAWFTFCYGIAFVGYEGCAQGLWFWYITLIRPAWDPPVWTVTPVCTILYGLTAYASWLVWTADTGRAVNLGRGGSTKPSPLPSVGEVGESEERRRTGRGGESETGKVLMLTAVADKGRRRSAALTLCVVQLALSGLWPWLIYGWHNLTWSLAEIVTLWVVMLTTTILFWRIKAPAGRLMIPSLATTAFVALLNFVVWRLNRP